MQMSEAIEGFGRQMVANGGSIHTRAAYLRDLWAIRAVLISIFRPPVPSRPPWRVTALVLREGTPPPADGRRHVPIPSTDGAS